MSAAILACCVLTAACGRPAADVSVAWTIEPAAPAAAAITAVRFTLADPQGSPVRGARLRLDAHMTHPGMPPVTSDVVETADGEYQARVRLTMAGEWVFVVSGELPDGRQVTREIPVPAVRAADAHAPGR